MKIEIDMTDELYRDLSLAARNLKVSRKNFVLKAIRRMAATNQCSGEELTASLNKFFEANPDCNAPWWEDGSDWSESRKNVGCG